MYWLGKIFGPWLLFCAVVICGAVFYATRANEGSWMYLVPIPAIVLVRLVLRSMFQSYTRSGPRPVEGGLQRLPHDNPNAQTKYEKPVVSDWD